METIHFASDFPPTYLSCKVTGKCSRKIVPSNQSSWFTLFCYLMESRNKRLSANSWPIPVRGESLLEVTICLVSLLCAILDWLLAKYEDGNEIWKEYGKKSSLFLYAITSRRMRQTFDLKTELENQRVKNFTDESQRIKRAMFQRNLFLFCGFDLIDWKQSDFCLWLKTVWTFMLVFKLFSAYMGLQPLITIHPPICPFNVPRSPEVTSKSSPVTLNFTFSNFCSPRCACKTVMEER